MKIGNRDQSGFTMIELMIVVAILAIIAAFGAPGMRDVLISQRVKSAAFELIANVMFARTEAIKRGVPISLVGGDGVGAFDQGWCVVFGAPPAPVPCDVNNPLTDEMRVQAPFLDINYVWRTPAAAAPIVFNRSGRLNAPVRIEISAAGSGAAPRCLTIDASGSASSALGVCP